MILPVDLIQLPTQPVEQAKSTPLDLFETLFQLLSTDAEKKNLSDLLEPEKEKDNDQQQITNTTQPVLLPLVLSPVVSYAGTEHAIANTREGQPEAKDALSTPIPSPFSLSQTAAEEPVGKPVIPEGTKGQANLAAQANVPLGTTPKAIRSELDRVQPSPLPLSQPPAPPTRHHIDFTDHIKSALRNEPAPLEQISLHLRRAVAEKADQIDIKLSPPDLGNVTIRLSVDEDKRVTAVFSAEKSQTLDLLHRDQKQLEQMLQGAGFKADDTALQFELSHHQRQDQSPHPLPELTLSPASLPLEEEKESPSAAALSNALIDLAI